MVVGSSTGLLVNVFNRERTFLPENFSNYYYLHVNTLCNVALVFVNIPMDNKGTNSGQKQRLHKHNPVNV